MVVVVTMRIKLIETKAIVEQLPVIGELLGGSSIERTVARLRRTPHLVAADVVFYSARNEAAAKTKGVKRVCIPNRSTKRPERKRDQKRRWFRNGQKWRTPAVLVV
jgi:IS5 family transposase